MCGKPTEVHRQSWGVAPACGAVNIVSMSGHCELWLMHAPMPTGGSVLKMLGGLKSMSGIDWSRGKHLPRCSQARHACIVLVHMDMHVSASTHT